MTQPAGYYPMPMHAPQYSAPNDMMMRQMQAQSAYDDVKKSAGVAYAFWFFLGMCGGHRFYMGDVGIGVGQLFTFGGVGFWSLIDVFFIGQRIRAINAQKKAEIFGRAGLPVF